jgi:hypothetical protein
MKTHLILADYNGGLIPLMVGGPLFVLGLVMLLIAGAASEGPKNEGNDSNRKLLFRIGWGFLGAALVAVVLGKKFGP